MPRVNIDKETVKDVVEELVAKFQHKLEEKGRHSLCSTHECLGLINEEHDELIGAVRSNSPDEFEKEMMDIGVCVILALASKRVGGLEW